jgi:transporter family protein
MWQTWLFLILTVIFWGTAPILEKYGLRYTDEFSALFIRSIAIFFILLIVFSLKGRITSLFEVPPRALVVFTLSGLLAGLLGMWTYFKVLKINPSSKVVPLVATYPLITAILSLLFLRENVSWQRILGTILIIIGVLLVK